MKVELVYLDHTTVHVKIISLEISSGSGKRNQKIMSKFSSRTVHVGGTW
jgi:hypothetical protein